ncbi:Glycoside Hydrolase Family 13 protein [Glomus cerebriforme]|uniref:alpha-amylase n=1 Tax=Glomus cerebriforme TaxID=658196 RepID=A0A397SWS8_9GLOM|nr:Glycoside Hydrolase Family 13 protein [Glomus cerebriforme]
MNFLTQKFFILATLLLLLTAPKLSLTRTADEWRTRTIFQLLTDRFAQTPGQENPQLCSDNTNEKELRHYCGGTFSGISSKLDYIKNLGCDAIWISPVVKQIENETIFGVGWHGYWAQDIYQVNPHFGTADDLKNFVTAAHNKDIWVMVDVVANHMGPQPNLTPRTDEYVKAYNPFNTIDDYHFYCPITNYNDQGNVEYCSLGAPDVPLPDLDTEHPAVVTELNKWINWLVKEFNFDAIRIDTVRHVRHDFWDAFAKSSGVFSIGEIPSGDSGFVASYQGHIDSTLGYPLYFSLVNLYSNSGANMYGMRDIINNNRKFYNDTRILGNFIDSHDQERFNHRTQDKVLTRNALAFVLLMDGIPIIYQGVEQDFGGNPTGRDPFNREALWPSSYSQSTPTYQFIANINAFRKVLPTSFYTSLSIEAWIDEHIYAFRKDKALIITSNYGGNNPNRDLVIQGNGIWPVGDVLVNIVKCEEKITIDGYSNVPVKIDGEPKVLYPANSLKGSRICGL